MNWIGSAAERRGAIYLQRQDQLLHLGAGGLEGARGGVGGGGLGGLQLLEERREVLCEGGGRRIGRKVIMRLCFVHFSFFSVVYADGIKLQLDHGIQI